MDRFALIRVEPGRVHTIEGGSFLERAALLAHW